MPSARRRGRPPGSITQPLKNDVAVLRAEGMSLNTIAKTLNVSPSTIDRTVRLPDVQVRVQELRNLWKDLAHQAIQKTASEGWQMAHESAEKRDYKGWDYTLRGLHAMEKISASVAGEGTKLEVSGLPPNAPVVDLKILLARLFQKPVNDA